MKSPILLEVPDRLQGKRVLLRSLHAGDGPVVNEAIVASVDHLRPWMPWCQVAPSQDESEEYVRRAHAKWILRESFGFGIFDLAETRVLGGAGIPRLDWEVRKFEIGYWIRPDAEGKGLITESVELLRDMAFESLNANRVFIRCDSANTRSAAVPKRLGFHHEGTLVNDNMGTDGNVHAMEMFGMTREMWLALRENPEAR